jgi:hypothetical protein
MNAPNSNATYSAPLGYYSKSLVSLLLWVHFLCLAAAFTGMFNPTRLHQRLVRTLSVYLQPLHLDPADTWQPTATNYFFTLLPSHSQTATQSNPLATIVLSGGRWAKLASSVERYSENEEWPALVGKSVSKALLREHQLSAGQLQVRRWKASATSVEIQKNDFEKSEVLYEADVWLSEDGELQLLKHIRTPDAAPALEESSS